MSSLSRIDLRGLLCRLRKASGYQMPRLGMVGYRLIEPFRFEKIRCELLPSIQVNLDLRDDTAWNIFYLGLRYETPTLSILERWASRGGQRFFDIGANFGFFSLALTNRIKNLAAVAFEPNPATFVRLKTILAENSLDRIEALPLALSSHAAELKFQCETGNSGASHVLSSSSSATDSITVPAVAFDQLAADHGWRGVPSFAKIDAEGHDEAVLAGMETSLKEGWLQGICIEMSRENLAAANSSPERLIERLERAGYHSLNEPSIRRAHEKRGTDNWFFERTV